MSKYIDLQVRINQGTVRGFREKSVNGREFLSFLGIPYAKPPVGNLRFKDPVPAEPWKGLLDATKDPPMCMQFNTEGFAAKNLIIEGQEDCLYLNVFTPQLNRQGSGLPVIVYIHGGYFIHNGAKKYKPTILLNEEVVLVFIQYRLGPFGFLSLGDTKDSTGSPILPGNYGLKDQILALRWVQHNIGHFGGDPSRVTLVGHSAGAASAHLLMLSPLTKGLFNGVIAMSGTASSYWSVNRRAKKYAKKFMQALGCPFEDENPSIAGLMTKSGHELMEGLSKMMRDGINPYLWMFPSIDGKVIPEDPLVLLAKGNYQKVNFMSGVAKDDSLLTVYPILIKKRRIARLLENVEDKVAKLLGFHDEDDVAGLCRKILDHYLHGKELTEENCVQLVKVATDRVYVVGHDHCTLAYAHDPSMKVYRFQLDWKGEKSYLDMYGEEIDQDWVCHGDILFYLLRRDGYFSNNQKDNQDLKLRDILVKMLTNFAATGNPTPDDSLGFRWESAAPTDFRHLTLMPEPFMSNHSSAADNKFWRSLPLTENKILNQIQQAKQNFKHRL